MRTLLLFLILFSVGTASDMVPPDFVDLKKAVPSLRIEARYFGSNNFVGRPVDGYEAPRCYLTRPAAGALKQAETALAPFGLGLKVFDAYRPQRAVDHFVRWAKDLDDTKMKAAYYPRVAKSVLFKAGYIAARSGHSRGSTVDLTLIDLESGAELDMGTGFDFFGPESWPESMAVTAQQRANRLLLRRVMTGAGFRPLPEEWWHFTLENEPYPDRYFDFPIR
ncbi:M15 family metallopeptidase [Thiomicrolovo sp. ZZH C-3]